MIKIIRNWKFTWWEVALFKICLITFGFILFKNFFTYLDGLMWLWWALFALTGLYFIGLFFNHKN